MICAALPFTGWLSSGSTRVWRGYQTLLINPDAVRMETAELIEARFGPGVADIQSATVDFWDFEGLARVSLARLEDRIDPSDPRHDRYVDGAPQYFRAEVRGRDWRVAYLPARFPAPRAFVRLIRTLGFPFGGAWRLMEFDPLEKGLSLVAFFCVVPLFAFTRVKSRRAEMGVAMACALLWTPFIISGEPSCFALALLLFMAWHPLMQAVLPWHWGDRLFHREILPSLLRFLAAAAAGCALLVTARRFSLSALPWCLAPASASLLLLAGIAGLKSGGAKPRKRRSKFEPVPIVRQSKKAAHGRTAARLLSLAALICVGLVPVMRGTRVPTPLPSLGARGFFWESLAGASRGTRPRLLPGYSDLVTHEAFQETLAFGRPWRTPVRDERVRVREYTISPATGVIRARERTVKVFDSTWLASVRRRARTGTLEALLFRQGRPVMTAMRRQGWLLLFALPVMLPAAAALLFLLIRERGVRPLIQAGLLRFNKRARRSQVP